METEQPWLALERLQSVLRVVRPGRELGLWIVQPGEVCRVMVFVNCALTPSIMSISPEEGQLGPNIQKAGQVPQPTGMWAMSAMKRP